MINPSILHPDPADEFPTPEGCHILESMNSDSYPDISLARARVPVGVTTELHRLDGSHEHYLIISGTGRMEVGDLPPTDVAPGDIVVIPDGISQRITNTCSTDLLFYCVCTPRFQQDMYVSLEDGEP